MQLVTARFQVDQTRPVTTCAWPRFEPDRSVRAVAGEAIPQCLRCGLELPSYTGEGAVRVHVRGEVDHDRGWILSHEKG